MTEKLTFIIRSAATEEAVVAEEAAEGRHRPGGGRSHGLHVVVAVDEQRGQLGAHPFLGEDDGVAGGFEHPHPVEPDATQVPGQPASTGPHGRGKGRVGADAGEGHQLLKLAQKPGFHGQRKGCSSVGGRGTGTLRNGGAGGGLLRGRVTQKAVKNRLMLFLGTRLLVLTVLVAAELPSMVSMVPSGYTSRTMKWC